jgi:hypothetical protein
MLQRLQASIDRGGDQIINKVLCELMADMRLTGSQQFAFHEYKDLLSDRLFAGHSNSSVSFQLVQLKVGEGKVLVSIVLYIDSKYLKKGIPIGSVHHKCVYISYPISCLMSFPMSYPM